MEAIVVGSGPNGLAAAVRLSQRGFVVSVLEANSAIGGGSRSAELTQPGFVHDVCSAIHPMGAASPFFRSLPLSSHGLDWIHPTVPLAHPLTDGRVAVVDRSLDTTASLLGTDGAAYRRLMAPFVTRWDDLVDQFLAPPRPRHPLLLARFGRYGIRSVTGLARSLFRGELGPALLAGCGAHSLLPLSAPPTAAIAVFFAASAHGAGWPLARGGSGRITHALASYLRSLGGSITTDHYVQSSQELADASCVLFDTAPRHLARIAREDLPSRYRRRLGRFRHGPGVFKVDFALSDPIPWTARDCSLAATVHVGGTLEEVAASELAATEGRIPEHPFLILAQQSLFDASRAPAGKHTVWAYCHVPNGSTVDMTERIERQIERFAPGFRDCIIAKRTMSPAELEDYNSNYIGGDIAGGSNTGLQFLARPMVRFDPYATPNRRLFICSSSTPPGGGVHGMCGYHAAESAARRHTR